MEHFQEKMLELRVDMSSLVGICGEPPVSHGNYFALDGYYVLNMWLENLEALLAPGQPLAAAKKLKALVSKQGKTAYLVDPRIPLPYLNRRLCVTGSAGYNQLTQPAYVELYRLLVPDWNPAEGCLCQRPNELRTVNWTRWGGPVRTGYCEICRREISQEVEAQSSGIVFVPYETKTEVAPITVTEASKVRYTQPITGQYVVLDSDIDVGARLRELAAKKEFPGHAD